MAQAPVGGAIIRRYLAEAGVDEKVLAPARFFSLETAASMSGGRVTPQMVARLVEEANA